MYLGELRIHNEISKKRMISGPPSDTHRNRSCFLPPLRTNCLYYNGPLMSKYKLTENGKYSSTSTGSIFENLISFVPGGIANILELWNSPNFQPVREMHSRRIEANNNSYYSFHTLTLSEINTIHNCLFRLK